MDGADVLNRGPISKMDAAALQAIAHFRRAGRGESEDHDSIVRGFKRQAFDAPRKGFGFPGSRSGDDAEFLLLGVHC